MAVPALLRRRQGGGGGGSGWAPECPPPGRQDGPFLLTLVHLPHAAGAGGAVERGSGRPPWPRQERGAPKGPRRSGEPVEVGALRCHAADVAAHGWGSGWTCFYVRLSSWHFVPDTRLAALLIFLFFIFSSLFFFVANVI